MVACDEGPASLMAPVGYAIVRAKVILGRSLGQFGQEASDTTLSAALNPVKETLN